MGRPKGSTNKMNDFQLDLVRAFNRCLRSEDWDKLVRAATQQVEEGKPQMFLGILPFVARKMPDKVEHDVVSRHIYALPPDFDMKQLENNPAEEQDGDPQAGT